jgi:hypothetical protein
MGTDITSGYSALRALLIQDPRLTFDSLSLSLSTLTQAGPLPGVPVAQQDTEMVLNTSGTQSAGGELRIRTIESGHPGVDGARFVWRNDGDSLWRGWDPPTVISGFEFIDRSTTSGYWKWPHAIVTSSGKIVLVAQREDQVVASFTRAADGTWGSEVEVYDRGSAYTDRASPCLVLLPSGRILCFFWRERGSSASVWMYFSDDDGATWTVGSRAALSSSLSTGTYTLGRLRAAYLDGQIILFGALTNGTTELIQQWASVDLGSSFDAVDSISGAGSAGYGYVDAISHGGSIVVAYLYDDGTDILPYVRRLGSAFEPISGATEALGTASGNAMQWGSSSAGNFTEGYLALWADDDGALYLAGLDHDAAGGALKELMLARSSDGGVSWSTLGDSSAANGTGSAVWYGYDASTYPSDFTAVSTHGQTVLIHRFKANPGTADDSLCQTTLGGYTTVEMPEIDALNLAATNRTSWEITWLPFDEPDNTGSSKWGKTTTGTPTVALNSAGLYITHTSGTDRTEWEATPATDGETIAVCEIQAYGGGPTGYLQVQVTNGTTLSTTVRIEVTSSDITFYDVEGAANLASPVSTAAALTGVQVKIASSGAGTAKTSGWWRALGSDQEWKAIATNTSTTQGTLTSGHVKFGSLVGSASSGTVAFRLTAANWGSYVGVGLSTGQSNPDDLLGRSYMPSAVYVDDGVSIAAIDGPTFRTDSWNIDSRYEHAVDHLHTDVTPSPRRGWRSTGTSATEIVWELSSTVSDVGQFTEDLLGIHLARINWQTGSLYGRESGGSWTKICDIDSSSGASGLAFVRNGASVGPDPSAGSDSSYWWPFDALSGCYWDNGTEIREIQTNVSGAWLRSATATNARQTRLTLASYSASDVSSGTSGAIWARDVTVVQPITGGTTYSAYKLVIDSQSTATGDLRIGSVLIGPVVVFGGEYGWGRGLSVDASIQRTEGRGGTRSARQLAPVRRGVEIGWPDGIDGSGVGQSSPAADFYRAYTGGPIVAGDGDSLWMMRGLLDHLSRTSGMVCYLPRVPIKGSSQTITINHREQHLFGRVVTDTHRVDNVQGEEWRSEVLRGGRLRIEEEL